MTENFESTDRFSRLNLRLGICIALSFFVTSAFVSIGMIINAVEQRHAQRETELRATANLLGATLSSSIAKGETTAIHQMLRGIRYSEWIDSVEVYGETGQRIGGLGMHAQVVVQGGKADQSWNLFEFSPPITITTPVIDGGKTVGEMRLAASGFDTVSSIAEEMPQVAFWSFLSALIGGTMAILFQRSMLRPIRQLSDEMMLAQTKQGLPERLDIVGEGEVGVLVSAYNRMIGAIETRDHALLQHQDMLEQRIEERTAEMHLARVEAERANEAKSRFLATMSHEIRTPMNGVLVMAELLSRADLPTAEHGYATVISRSGKALLNLLNDLLDFSKIEAGRMELECIEFGIDEIVNDVTMLFWQRARDSDLSLVSRIGHTVPKHISGDPTRLQQCLSNLVGNAVKFTESGAVTIEVDWAADPADASRGVLAIDIRDTGIGIPEDRLDTIFDSFTQADETTTRNFGGTGLGLAITRQLVEAMDGTVLVQSEPGKGSCFQVRLPVSAEHGAASDQFADLGTVIVDIDNPYERANIVAALHERGVDTDGPATAASGRIAGLSRLDVPDAPPVPTICYWNLGEPAPRTALKNGSAVDVLHAPATRDGLDTALKRLATADFRKVGALTSSAGPQDGDIPDFSGLTILVADDNEANRQVIADALSIMGVQATIVCDGKAALEELTDCSFDLVFLDGYMPVMDGFETVAHARERALTNASGERLPIYLFSATPPDEKSAKSRVGFDGFLPKPFELDELATILKTVHSPGSVLQDAATSKIEGDAVDAEPEGLISGKALTTLRALDSRRPGTFAKVSVQFTNAIPGLVQEIRACNESRDAACFARAVHGMKSMAGTVGAVGLSTKMGAIEKSARAASAQGLPYTISESEIDVIDIMARNAASQLENELHVV